MAHLELLLPGAQPRVFFLIVDFPSSMENLMRYLVPRKDIIRMAAILSAITAICLLAFNPVVLAKTAARTDLYLPNVLHEPVGAWTLLDISQLAANAPDA